MQKLSSDTGYFKKPVEINRGIVEIPICRFFYRNDVRFVGSNIIILKGISALLKDQYSKGDFTIEFSKTQKLQSKLLLYSKLNFGDYYLAFESTF